MIAIGRTVASRPWIPLLVLAALIGVTIPQSALGDIPRAAQKSGAGQAPATSPEVAHMLSDAKAAIKRGDLPLALILLKNAVNAAPKNGYVRAQLGLEQLMVGNFPDAESQLRQARIDHAPDEMVLPALFDAMLARGKAEEIIAEFPDPGAHSDNKSAPDILKARAVALQSLGQPAEAVTEMDRSLTYRRDIPGLLTRARIAQQQKDMGTAQRLADEALRLDPQSLDVLIFQTGLALQAQNNNQALALANRAVQYHPNDLAARSTRIEVYLTSKMDAKAKPEVDAILVAHPHLPSALYYRALLLARSGHTKDAWGIAESLPPEFVQSQQGIATTVAEIAVADGNLETAGAILGSALVKNPGDVNMRLRLASIRLQQGSAEIAINILTPLKDSNDPRAQSLLGEAHMKAHHWSDALGYLEKATAVPNASPLLKQQLAETEMQVGQDVAAIKELSDLAEKEPANEEVGGQLIAALTRAKRFDDAVREADALSKALPRSPAPGFYRGEVLFAKGDLNGALTALNASLGSDPHFLPSLYYRAGVYDALGRYPEADHDLQQILSRDPKNVQALVKDAEIALRSKHDADVPKLLGRAIAASSEDPTPRLALANFFMSKGNLDAARKVDNDLLRILPTNPEALALSAALEWAAGEKQKAVETYHRLDTLIPRSVAVKILLSRALAGTGDKLGAEYALEDAVRDNPDSVQARRELIVMKSSLGDGDGAIQVANDYAAGHSGTDADLLLADALLRNHQPEKAVAVLTKSLTNHPDSHTIISLANVLMANNRASDAQKPLADWLNKHPSDIDVRRIYASLLLQLGDNVNATAQYEIIVRAEPKNAESLNNLGWLIQKDDPARALRLVALAAQLSPNSADIVDTFGWIKFSQNDPVGALALLQKAHNMRKTDGEISYHLVLALNATGKHDDAKVLLQSVLSSRTKFADLARAQQLASEWH